MTTIPIEDEKDLRLIADMEFANDTSPEEKTLLRKWTKMFEEVRDVRLEITRCKEMIQDKTLPGVLSSWLTDPSLAAHIKGEEVRADKIDAEMKPLWAEYEVLRDRMVPVRREKAERVQKLLMNHGVQRAQEIIDNGCTGLFRLFLPSDEEGPIGFASGIHSSLQEGKEETAIETVRFVRENMGGARVSLPCYVGPDRYCLIHQTIGGLQFGQKALHADQVRYISRDLTPEEKGHVNLVENVRRREGNMRDGKAILTGQRVPDDLGIESLSPQDAAFKRQMDAAGVSSPGVVVPEVPPFTCPEHGAISWGCRYCLAQALVNGPLEVEITAQATIATIEGQGTGPLQTVAASGMAAYLENLDAGGAHEVKVYAKVASFRRKLAMD